MTTFRQLRSATTIVEIGGVRFLTDPWLAPKDTFEGFPGSYNRHLRQPLVELPVTIEEAIDVDAVIVTHLHPDHWDRFAVDALPADTPIFTQHLGDRELLRAGKAQIIDGKGLWYEQVDGKTFSDVRNLTGNPSFNGVKLTKVPGQHGSDEGVQKAYDVIQEVSGVVLSAPGEKTIYVAGDTVWNHYVAANIAQYAPDVIVVNAAGAVFEEPDTGPIIMTVDDVIAVAQAAPDATVIASHLEGVNHGTVTRAALRERVAAEGLTERVLVPEDGDTLTF